MAVQISDGKTLKRLVKIHGVTGLVEVELSEEGLRFRVPKTSKYVTISWFKAVLNSTTPVNVKSFLAGKPFEMLNWEQQTLEKRAIKRLEKKEKI